MQKRMTTALAGLLVLAALALASGTAASGHRPGAVYTLTNSAAGNAVAVFDRGATERSPRPGPTRPAASARAAASARRARSS